MLPAPISLSSQGRAGTRRNNRPFNCFFRSVFQALSILHIGGESDTSDGCRVRVPARFLPGLPGWGSTLRRHQPFPSLVSCEYNGDLSVEATFLQKNHFISPTKRLLQNEDPVLVPEYRARLLGPDGGTCPVVLQTPIPRVGAKMR